MDGKVFMDKPRFLFTWLCAAVAAGWAYNDSFWWALAKIVPIAILAQVAEHVRSKIQNGEM
jgi:hypothetical protein